ncbi:sulfotransferase domain-containing protein [Alcanivorax sp. IL2]|uniref:sulfotransferase domain-containing protein n=1 Tax=Alcanivorax sp. IL2 TaxID=3396310 RepID=UPI0039C3641A
MSKLYLHLGAPKTGSTALQRNVFERIEPDKGNFLYIGKYGENNNNFFSELCSSINKWSLEEFLYRYKAINEALREKIREYPDGLLVSDESFIVVSYSVNGKITVKDKIDRLSKVLEGVPVELILSIRNQATACYSLYKELYSNYKILGGVSLPPKINDSWEELYATYDYSLIVDGFISKGVASNLYVFLYEDFQKNPSLECEKLMDFIGFDIGSIGDMPVVNNKKTSSGMTILPDKSLKRFVEILILKNRIFLFVVKFPLIRNVLSLIWRNFGGVLDKFRIKNNERLPLEDKEFEVIAKKRFSASNRRLASNDSSLRDAMEKYGYYLK